MLLDYDAQKPIDLLPNRKKNDLLEYFRGFSLSERRKVKYIAADMYKTYRDVCQQIFPNATYAVDRFHVMQDFTRQFDRVRIRVMKGTRTDSDEYYLLKKQNHLLAIKPDAKKPKQGAPKKKARTKDDYEFILDPAGEREYDYHFKEHLNKYELLKRLLNISDELRKSYEFRNRMSRFFRENTIETAPAELEKLIADLDGSNIREMMAFAETARPWFGEIINSFTIIKEDYTVTRNGALKKNDYRLTSSMIENRNKYVKQIKNNANGYTNWRRFRNRVLYVLRKDIPLDFTSKEEEKQDDKNPAKT